jgi:hypothetical protein
VERDYLIDMFSALPRNYREPVRVGIEQFVQFNVVIHRYKSEYVKAEGMLLEGSKLPLSKVATRVAVLLVALVEDDPSLASLIGDESYMAAPQEIRLRQLQG